MNYNKDAKLGTFGFTKWNLFHNHPLLDPGSGEHDAEYDEQSCDEASIESSDKFDTSKTFETYHHLHKYVSARLIKFGIKIVTNSRGERRGVIECSCRSHGYDRTANIACPFRLNYNKDAKLGTFGFTKWNLLHNHPLLEQEKYEEQIVADNEPNTYSLERATSPAFSDSSDCIKNESLLDTTLTFETFYELHEYASAQLRKFGIVLSTNTRGDRRGHLYCSCKSYGVDKTIKRQCPFCLNYNKDAKLGTFGFTKWNLFHNHPLLATEKSNLDGGEHQERATSPTSSESSTIIEYVTKFDTSKTFETFYDLREYASGQLRKFGIVLSMNSNKLYCSCKSRGGDRSNKSKCPFVSIYKKDTKSGEFGFTKWNFSHNHPLLASGSRHIMNYEQSHEGSMQSVKVAANQTTTESSPAVKPHVEVGKWLCEFLPKDDAARYLEILIENGFDTMEILRDVLEERSLKLMKDGHRMIAMMKLSQLRNEHVMNGLLMTL